MVRFDGEQGFTRVAVGHARGFVYRSLKESCKGSKSNGHPATSIHLTERAKSDGRTTVFSATKPTGGSPFAGSCFYFVSQWQRRHGMTSVKVAATKAAENTFVVTGSNQPESATITPPSPFSGTASFHASPGAMAEWEGTLTVDLPGVNSVGGPYGYAVHAETVPRPKLRGPSRSLRTLVRTALTGRRARLDAVSRASGTPTASRGGFGTRRNVLGQADCGRR